MAEGILAFLRCPPEDKQLRSASEEEVRTERGAGFIKRHGAEYNPTYDLSKLIVQIRRIVAADRYEPVVVSVGDKLAGGLVGRYSSGPNPVAYFERGTALADALRGIRAGAAVVAELRPAYQPFYEPQTLVVSLVECGDEATARFLLERSENNGLGEASNRRFPGSSSQPDGGEEVPARLPKVRDY